jgi:hypothetical protein
MKKLLVIVIIGVLVGGCSEVNNNKILNKIAKCADQKYVKWNENFSIEKISKTKLSKKLESPVYDSYFAICESDLKDNPLKFEAKYLQ